MVLSTPAPQGQCIRLANIDYYLSNRPTPWDLPAVHPDLLSGTPQQVPVLRVFGRLASTNQAACLHIHRVWPYLYFPLTSSEPVTVAARRQILAALNAALATAVGRSTWQASQSPLVAGLELVRGTPFYGHRFGEQYFWKLYYVNPAHGSTLAALLQKGTALGTPCEVYEAHIPYILQFMVDFNLYGMRWIHVERSKERPSGPLDPEFATVGLDHAQPMGPTERLTWCQAELDTLAAHIGNRRSVGARYIHARVDGAAPPSPTSHAKFVPSLAAIEALVHGFVRDLISSPSASTPSHPGKSVTPRPCSTAKTTATHEPTPKTAWGMHARLLDQLQAVLLADSYQAETAEDHLSLSSEELGHLCHPHVDLLPTERIELFDQLRQHWETFPTNLPEPSAGQATAPQDLSHPVTTAFESLFLASDVAKEHDLVSRPPSRMASLDMAWQLDIGAIKGLQSPFESPYRRPTKAPSPGAQATQVATPTEHPAELDALEHQMSQLCAALERHPDVEPAVEEEEAEGEGASDGNRGQQLDDVSADDEEIWEALRDMGQTEEGGDLGLTYRSGMSGSEGSTEESNNDDCDAVMGMPELPARGQPAVVFPESLLSQPPFGATTPPALDIPQMDGADDDEDEDGETDMDYTFPDSDRFDARTSRTRGRAGHPPRLRRTMLQFSRQPLTPKPGIASSRRQVVARAVSVQRKEVAAPRSLASEHGRDPIEPTTPNHHYTPAKRNTSIAPLSAIRPLQFTNSRRVKREAVRGDPSLNRDNATGEDLALPRKRRSTDRTAETSTATRWGHPTVIRTLQPLAYAGPAATHLTPTARAQPRLNIPTQTGDERYQSVVDKYDPSTAPQLSEEFNCIPSSPGEPPEIPVSSGHRYQMTAPVNSPAPHARDCVRLSQPPLPIGTLVYRYRNPPPTADALQGSLRDYGLLQAPYPPPLPADPPVRAAHSRFDPGFRHWTTATKPPSPRSVCAWLNKNPLVPVPPATPTLPAPAHQARPAPTTPIVNPAVVSQIEGPLPFLAEAFKISQRYSTPTAGEQSVLLSVLSLEIHVNTRGELLPDPLHDPVTAIFCNLWLPVDEADDTHPPAIPGTHVAPPVKSNPCFVLYHEPTSSVSDQASPDRDSPRRNDRQAAILTACRRASRQVQIIVLDSERALLETLITLVTHAWDPDVLSGYELQNSSWGYLVERCSTVYQVDLGLELSRLRPPEGGGPPLPRPSASHSSGNSDRNAAAEYLMRKASSLQVPGRHVLNLWRVLRNRCTLNIYTFENVVYHFLHHRTPYFDPATLTQWYTDGPDLLRGRAFEYHLERTLLNNRLLDASDALHQASEFAGIYGVDFFSVLTRGSQYKVEAMMLRVAKPENLLLLSPSKERVAQQRATECLPLVMEPRSDVYRSPVLVLDFQSLYPSLMIAYNYCYSTCLGTVRTPGTRQAIGATQIELPRGLVSTLVRHNQLQIAPNGAMYVKSDVRRSLLARLLSEILDTRVMIKRRMADLKRVLQGLEADVSSSAPAASRLRTRLRKLEAFQMALKMIANVTYGYVGASYSGRMPCADVADSIVQTGRETLERTIATINAHPTWGSQVVYGDTDSVFVHLPGASRDRAFDVGEEIARTITQMNPAPVKLKFEKVYQPCVLLAKKRYTGFKYEYRGQTEPEFEGKGTETVRRDGCPATQKMMEKCLRLLFTTNDLSVVRSYLHREWGKIMVGRVNVQDFLFAKEVRLGKYSLGGTHLPPPGVIVALKRMARDPRQAPQYGERVPYIVAYGGPQDRLADQILDPREFLAQSHLRLHGRYYVLKQIIPPLNRVFTLIGVDLHLWFAAMPRTSHEDRRAMSVRNASKAAGAPQRALVAQATLHHYFDSGACVACAAPARQELCVTCQTNPPSTAYVLLRKLRQTERRFDYLTKACQGCTGLSRAALRPGHGGPLVCASLDCPLYFDNVKCCADLLAGDTYADALSLLEF
ncbi:DNA polymerase zeta [Tieghemiomyces parasiticus]|uniref:DNA polymerase n=1 Tax=Tieghemiomyces parasiticus TaxID=78921 RepID=A0A9W8AAX5_9FUNG|nr:DNA polymerase zeta [Tieghemiomyces parasiticus]